MIITGQTLLDMLYAVQDKGIEAVSAKVCRERPHIIEVALIEVTIT